MPSDLGKQPDTRQHPGQPPQSLQVSLDGGTTAFGAWLIPYQSLTAILLDGGIVRESYGRVPFRARLCSLVRMLLGSDG